MHVFFTGQNRQKNICYLALAIYLLAQFGRGTNSTLLIFDNLEIITPMFSTLTPEQLFGRNDAIIPNIMGGIPLWAILGAGPLNLVADANVFLGGFMAIVVVESIIRLLALWSMPKLLLRYASIKDPTIAWGVGLCFSVLPVCFPLLGVILLMPLVALSFLELLVGRKKWWAAGLAVYPLFCPLPLGFPVFFLLGGIALYRFRNNHTLLLRALYIFGLFMVFYAAIEYRILLQVFLHQGFVSHRTERAHPSLDIPTAIHDAGSLLLTGDGELYTSGQILPFVLFSIVYVLCIPKQFLNKFPKVLWLFFALHIMLALLAAFWNTAPLLIVQSLLHIEDINVRRFIYIWPILLYTAWAIALKALPSRWPCSQIILAGQFVYLCFLSQAAIALSDSQAMSYEQFFSAPLFAKVQEAIGEPQSSYRVVSLGLPANIPLYSGFYTLDGYLNNYPLEYKHRFRSVIAPDLDQDGVIFAYMRGKFDWNGNFLNIFTGDLGWYFLGDRYVSRGKAQYMMLNAAPIHLKSDLSGFYPFGVRYLLSAVEITDAWKNGLTLVGVFSDKKSPYIIHLYRIHKPL